MTQDTAPTVTADVTTTPPAVAIRGLVKRFGDLTAVDHLDLSIAAGEVYGLLGPNGAGKTTTIRCAMGYLVPTAGEALLLGGDARDPAVRRRIGYLPSDPGLDRRMRVLDLLRWYGTLRGGVDPAVVRGLAERLDLPLDRRIGELSRGNRQKVGVVQAFMHHPALVVLDEATSGLDPLVQREVLRLIREAAAGGTAFLFSSHVLPEVEEIAGRVGILRQGRMVVEDTVAGLLGKATQHLEFTLEQPLDPEMLRGIPGVVGAHAADHRLYVQVNGSAAELVRALAPVGVSRVATDVHELDDVFFDYYEGNEGESA
jgi:ABC-2 type transport system ATP-binding protein